MLGFLKQEQIFELLELFRLSHTVFMGEMLGLNTLSATDLMTLKAFGVDPTAIMNKMPRSEVMYNMGRLSASLEKARAKKLTYEEVTKLVMQGAFRKLNPYEVSALEGIKNQSYWAIKGLENTVMKDVHDVIIKDGSRVRGMYEDIIRDEARMVIEEKKSLQSMMLDIGHRTGDWTRKLSRVVETEMHNTFDNGRAVTFAQMYGEDCLVYKDVKAGACVYCVKLYLTAGYGSEPRIFKLSDLIKNGTNVGRKASEYLPIIGATHPYDRCTIESIPVGYEWDTETGDFSKPSTKNWRKTNAHKMAPILVTTSSGVHKV